MSSRITANAWVFLFLTAFTIGVAMFLQNPLLVYTAIFLATTNIALYIWSLVSVRGLNMRRRPPPLGVAGQPLEVKLELNNERHMARFGTLGFDLHKGMTPDREYSPVAFMLAPKGDTVSSSYTVTPCKRGVYRLGPLYLWGGDPFGFYKCWRKLENYSSLVVLPRALQFKLVQPPSISHLARDEMGSIPQGGHSTEFLGVREYVAGEPLKHLHWRTSARMGKLISRQYEMNVAAAVSALLIVDRNMLSGVGADSPLEYAITLIASLGAATGSERFQFNYLALGARTQAYERERVDGVESEVNPAREQTIWERLNRDIFMRDTHERRASGKMDSSQPHDSLAGSGKRFYQEFAIRLARLAPAGEIDWTQANRLIVHYLPQGSRLVVFTCEPTEEVWERLGLLALRFSGITVINFVFESFEHQRRHGAQRSTTEIVRQRRGYNVIDVECKDDLVHVLSNVFGRAKAQTVDRRGRVAGSSKMLADGLLGQPEQVMAEAAAAGGEQQ